MQSEKIMAAFVRAWNERDIDSVLRLISPYCTLFDAYYADLVPAWNIAEHIKNDIDSANVRYTISNVIQCNAEIAEYYYVAQVFDASNVLIANYDGVDRLCLHDGRICRVTDYYVAPPELLSTYYQPGDGADAKLTYREASEFSISTILECRRKLIRGMQSDIGFARENLTLRKFAGHIGYPEELISIVLRIAFHRQFDEYVEKCRVDCARDMIQQQVLAGFRVADLGVDKRIAAKVGFKSHRSLVSAFKQVFGHTPRQFRGALQEQLNADFSAAQNF